MSWAGRDLALSRYYFLPLSCNRCFRDVVFWVETCEACLLFAVVLCWWILEGGGRRVFFLWFCRSWGTCLGSAVSVCLAPCWLRFADRRSLRPSCYAFLPLFWLGGGSLGPRLWAHAVLCWTALVLCRRWALNCWLFYSGPILLEFFFLCLFWTSAIYWRFNFLKIPIISRFFNFKLSCLFFLMDAHGANFCFFFTRSLRFCTNLNVLFLFTLVWGLSGDIGEIHNFIFWKYEILNYHRIFSETIVFSFTRFKIWFGVEILRKF